MTPERYQRVCDLIAEMLAADTSRWPAMLAEADQKEPGIRADAERLLVWMNEADRFLEEPLMIEPPSPFHEDEHDPFGLFDMTAERYHRVSDLVAGVFAADTSRWPAMLAEADQKEPGIRADAERLLVWMNEADRFLEEPLMIEPPSPFHEDEHDPFGILDTTIDSTYRIEELVGRGGMGAVYRARHLRLPRDVAIKVVREELVRYVRVEGAAGQINHRNVVAITDLRMLPTGESYLVMDYVEGESLRSALRRVPRPRFETTCGIVSQVASALDAAHAAGFVHRDIKPENILISSNGAPGTRVRVIDFGIALDIRDAGDDDAAPDGVHPGTPRYMSPEQWCAGGLVGPASDVFSLGLVAFEMLAGEPAFDLCSNETIREQVTRGNLKSLEALAPDLPDYAVSAVDKALAVRPQDRFESAGDFAEALCATGARRVKKPVAGVRPGRHVVRESLRPLDRLDIQGPGGVTSIELYLGDLLAIPKAWNVDVLAVAGLPEDLTAAPGTVGADIQRKGVDAQHVRRGEEGEVHVGEPEVLLRGKRHESKPLPPQRIRGLELGDEVDPRQQVDNMFEALKDVFGKRRIRGVVAMPLSELLPHREPDEVVSEPVLRAVVDRIYRGVDVSRLIIVEGDETLADAARAALRKAAADASDQPGSH